MAVGFEVLWRDAKFFARDLDDRPLLRSLRDFDVGLGIDVLDGGHQARPFWPSFMDVSSPVLPCSALRINLQAGRRCRRAQSASAPIPKG
jgi:hypothetical protein